MASITIDRIKTKRKKCLDCPSLFYWLYIFDQFFMWVSLSLFHITITFRKYRINTIIDHLNIKRLKNFIDLPALGKFYEKHIPKDEYALEDDPIKPLAISCFYQSANFSPVFYEFTIQSQVNCWALKKLSHYEELNLHDRINLRVVLCFEFETMVTAYTSQRPTPPWRFIPKILLVESAPNKISKRTI